MTKNEKQIYDLVEELYLVDACPPHTSCIYKHSLLKRESTIDRLLNKLNKEGWLGTNSGNYWCVTKQINSAAPIIFF
jgi:hypothetical protein